MRVKLALSSTALEVAIKSMLLVGDSSSWRQQGGHQRWHKRGEKYRCACRKSLQRLSIDMLGACGLIASRCRRNQIEVSRHHRAWRVVFKSRQSIRNGQAEAKSRGRYGIGCIKGICCVAEVLIRLLIRHCLRIIIIGADANASRGEVKSHRNRKYCYKLVADIART